MKQILLIVRSTLKFWPYYAATSFFIVVIALLNLVNPLLNKSIVDLIVNNTQHHESDLRGLIILLILFFATDAITTVFTNITGYLGDILAAKLNTDLGKKFYKKVLNLEIQYFDNEVSGKIMSKLQRGISSITNFINQMLNNFLPFILTAVFTIIFLAFYSWEIALMLAVLFPIYIIISDKSSKKWRERQDEINKVGDKLYGRVLESINSIRIVKSFIKEKIEYGFFKNERSEIEKLTKIQSRGYHLFDDFRRLILNLVLFAIFAYIIYYTYNGRFSISEMVLLVSLVNQARFPLFAMSFILGQIQQAQSGSKDFFEVLNQKIEIEDSKDAVELNNVKGTIEFKNISFQYNEDKKVLNDLSFTLKQGEKLALVGESGEGKSTISNLILRFYEPQIGSISIDGKDIKDIKQHSLHANIGVVMQDSLLFSGTIKENIKYGKEHATDEEIIQAAKDANAYDFIMAFPKGFDTEIGERGTKLSGGQKQRISISRAILKDAPILILDEATSSLDSKAEKEVQSALDRLMHNRTTLIIAHRLATIKNVDHIIVIKGGKIFEEGSPAELLKANGIYAELVRLQSTVQEPQPQNKTLKEFGLN